MTLAALTHFCRGFLTCVESTFKTFDANEPPNLSTPTSRKFQEPISVPKSRNSQCDNWRMFLLREQRHPAGKRLTHSQPSLVRTLLSGIGSLSSRLASTNKHQQRFVTLRPTTPWVALHDGGDATPAARDPYQMRIGRTARLGCLFRRLTRSCDTFWFGKIVRFGCPWMSSDNLMYVQCSSCCSCVCPAPRIFDEEACALRVTPTGFSLSPKVCPIGLCQESYSARAELETP